MASEKKLYMLFANKHEELTREQADAIALILNARVEKDELAMGIQYFFWAHPRGADASMGGSA